jgi:hypothetical protein
MRLPPIRLRLWMLMVLVAVVAGGMRVHRDAIRWLSLRRLDLQLRALDHAIGEGLNNGTVVGCRGIPPPRNPQKAAYHARLKLKYQWAADRPWFPVWPDLPEPN